MLYLTQGVDKVKKNMFIMFILLILLSIGLAFLLRKEKPMKEPINNNNTNNNVNNNITIGSETNFDYKIIKETNNLHTNQNYMISPLSIAYALSMLKEGAKEETLTEIKNVLGDYRLPSNIYVKDKISIANLLFIKNSYKNDISDNYINTLKNNYDSEVLFDDFKTPDPINNWVKNKTFNMIKDPVKEVSPDLVLGLANAMAIDVEWSNKFECDSTRSKEFTTEDDKKINVAMMHGSNDVRYIESKDAKGIIKDYAIYNKDTGEISYTETDNTVLLEYIAILPNKNINDYIRSFNKNELNTLYKSAITPGDADIYYQLPKYTYDFDYNDFKTALRDMGIKKVFNLGEANLKGMLNDNSTKELYMSDALHKTHIELSENGTKAAAVTIFMVAEGALLEEPKEMIEINFNRPFIYLIKEKNTDNIWFFGTVYKPMLFKDNKCEVERK